MLPDLAREAIIKKMKVRFVRYFDGNLWYQTENGYDFPVPISDTGTATFKAEDSAPFFMRWMRMYADMIEGARNAT